MTEADHKTVVALGLYLGTLVLSAECMTQMSQQFFPVWDISLKNTNVTLIVVLQDKVTNQFKVSVGFILRRP